MSEDPKRALGQRTKQHRTRLRLTQEALAERAGVTSRTIQRVESGEHNTLFDNLAQIASALEVPLHELLEPIEHSTSIQSKRMRELIQDAEEALHKDDFSIRDLKIASASAFLARDLVTGHVANHIRYRGPQSLRHPLEVIEGRNYGTRVRRTPYNQRVDRQRFIECEVLELRTKAHAELDPNPLFVTAALAISGHVSTNCECSNETIENLLAKDRERIWGRLNTKLEHLITLILRAEKMFPDGNRSGPSCTGGANMVMMRA